MKDLIDAYKKDAERLDNEFLDLFRKKMNLISIFKSNVLLYNENNSEDDMLKFTSYEDILRIIRKYNKFVRVDDFKTKSRHELIGNDLITDFGVFQEQDKILNHHNKHTFYFNAEVEEFCKNEMNNKFVLVNTDVNINANVFLGTVVYFDYIEVPKKFENESALAVYTGWTIDSP